MIHILQFSLINVFAIIADILVEDYSLFPSCSFIVILNLALN
jgi:hypothetical protein